MTIQEWQKVIYDLNVEKGWWPKGKENDRSAGEQFMNVASEISEAWEEYRKDGFTRLTHSATSYPYQPEGVGIELADVVIRIMDICEAHGIDLEEMIRIKYEYNKTRPYRHGNKLA